MIPEPDALDEVGNYVMSEVENLPLADLDRLIRKVSDTEDSACHYRQFLQGVLQLGDVGQAVALVGAPVVDLEQCFANVFHGGGPPDLSAGWQTGRRLVIPIRDGTTTGR